MTEYQEHFMYPLSDFREYELLFFLNGFSNISLSGNITHSYNQPGQMFTIHYMTCEGEENLMGWINAKDYVLFTTVLTPK